MFKILTTRVLHQIDVIQEFLNIHNNVLTGLENCHQGNRFSNADYKMYTASSCITRLYAVFERFIETISSDYLDNISEIIKFSKLPNEFRAEYRFGISHILNKLDNQRYSHLNHENIVAWYHEALRGKRNYRFVNEALTRHEQNFRLSIIESLLSRLQMKDLKTWLNNNHHINLLYPINSHPYEQIQIELSNLIQLRNDAAHGNLYNIEGLEILDRYCNVIKALVLSISSFVHKDLLLKKYDSKKFKKIGTVTEVFAKNGAFILTARKGVSLNIGTELHFVGTFHCTSQSLNSIQINDESVESVTTTSTGIELGLKCDYLVSKKTIVYVEYAT